MDASKYTLNKIGSDAFIKVSNMVRTNTNIVHVLRNSTRTFGVITKLSLEKFGMTSGMTSKSVSKDIHASLVVEARDTRVTMEESSVPMSAPKISLSLRTPCGVRRISHGDSR